MVRKFVSNPPYERTNRRSRSAMALSQLANSAFAPRKETDASTTTERERQGPSYLRRLLQSSKIESVNWRPRAAYQVLLCCSTPTIFLGPPRILSVLQTVLTCQLSRPPRVSFTNCAKRDLTNCLGIFFDRFISLSIRFMESVAGRCFTPHGRTFLTRYVFR